MLLTTPYLCIREKFEAILKTRKAYLEAGILDLHNDKSGDRIVKALFSHPLMHCLFLKTYEPSKPSEKPSLLARGRDLPSYISARNFARMRMDIAARGKETDAERVIIFLQESRSTTSAQTFQTSTKTMFKDLL